MSIRTWQERVAFLPYLKLGMLLLDRDKTIAMQAEIDELREAFANLHSYYDMIEIDREELRAELAKKTESEKKWIALHGAVCDLHDKAKAKLAALESQPAVAAFNTQTNELFWTDINRMKWPHGACCSDAIPEWFEKLYAEAGAAQVQHESVEHSGELAYHNGRSAYELTKVPSSGWTLFGDMPTYAQAYWIAKAAVAAMKETNHG